MTTPELKIAVCAGVAAVKGQWSERLSTEERTYLCVWAVVHTDALALAGFRAELEQIRDMYDPEVFVHWVIEQENLI